MNDQETTSKPEASNETSGAKLSGAICSPWVLTVIEELREGIRQAHMSAAQHGDGVLLACMEAHHTAANRGIAKLGGEAVELPNLKPFMANDSSRFWYVDVTSPGAEGTINLMWKEYPIQWISNTHVAAEIRRHLEAANS